MMPAARLRRLSRPLWLAGALAASAGMLAAPAGHAAAPDVLTLCTDGAPEGFDIAQAELAVTVDMVGHTLYDTLLRQGPQGLEPGLAERWTLSPDGLRLTLRLRAGVRFHRTEWFQPTRALQAEDVVFSLARQFDRRHWAHAVARRGYVTWAALGLDEVVREVRRVDERTVELRLARRHAPLLAALTVPQIGAVLSAEYAQQLHRAGRLDDLDRLPVGSGPYAYKRYARDASLRLVPHPDASRLPLPPGARPPGEVVMAITPDPDVRLQRLRAGECLAGLRMRESSVDLALAQAPRLRRVTHRPPVTTFLALNTRRAPLHALALRQALARVVDRAGLIRALVAGYATPAAGVLPPGMWGRHDDLVAPARDLAQARALMREVPPLPRELVLLVGTGPDLRQAAALLQADAAAIGVRLRIEAPETGALYERAARGDYDLMLQGWMADDLDPDSFLSAVLSCAAVLGGSNKAGWCDAQFDAQLDAARGSTDPAQRRALYRLAQQRAHEQLPLIPLYHGQHLTLLDRRVGGWQTTPAGLLDLRGVWLAAGDGP